MHSNSFLFYGLKTLAELARDIIYFPVWWYSRGLLNLAVGFKNFLSDKQKSLALLVWLKNIFKPMYAQYDWAGMLISFFVRLVQIIVRGVIMIFWLIFALAIFMFWLLFPALVIYEIIFQLM